MKTEGAVVYTTEGGFPPPPPPPQLPIIATKKNNAIIARNLFAFDMAYLLIQCNIEQKCNSAKANPLLVLNFSINSVPLTD